MLRPSTSRITYQLAPSRRHEASQRSALLLLLLRRVSNEHIIMKARMMTTKTPGSFTLLVASRNRFSQPEVPTATRRRMHSAIQIFEGTRSSGEHELESIASAYRSSTDGLPVRGRHKASHQRPWSLNMPLPGEGRGRGRGIRGEILSFRGIWRTLRIARRLFCRSAIYVVS